MFHVCVPFFQGLAWIHIYECFSCSDVSLTTSNIKHQGHFANTKKNTNKTNLKIYLYIKVNKKAGAKDQKLNIKHSGTVLKLLVLWMCKKLKKGPNVPAFQQPWTQHYICECAENPKNHMRRSADPCTRVDRSVRSRGLVHARLTICMYSYLCTSKCVH